MDEACLDMAEALGLSAAKLARHARRLRKHLVRPGASLEDQVEDSDCVYVVTGGLAKTVLCFSGLEMDSGFATRSSILGTDRLSGLVFETRTVALTLLAVVSIPTDVLDRLLRLDDEFRQVFYRKLGATILEHCAQIDLLTLHGAEGAITCASLDLETDQFPDDACIDPFDEVSESDERSAKRIRVRNRAALARLRTGKDIN